MEASLIEGKKAEGLKVACDWLNSSHHRAAGEVCGVWCVRHIACPIPYPTQFTLVHSFSLVSLCFLTFTFSHYLSFLLHNTMDDNEANYYQHEDHDEEENSSEGEGVTTGFNHGNAGRGGGIGNSSDEDDDDEEEDEDEEEARKVRSSEINPTLNVFSLTHLWGWTILDC